MQKIRLSRIGRKNLSTYRVVLTEHSRPTRSGYSEILWSYDPLSHELVIDADRVEELIWNGVQLSERVAKLMFKKTNNDLYKKFFILRESQKKTKNPDKYA